MKSFHFSGIENEHEIYSCAQLEAQQQELSKSIETTAATTASLSGNKSPDPSDIKVIKKDNIVLGISDLKQQQQRKLSADSKANNNSGTNKSVSKTTHTIVDAKEDNNNSVGQSVLTINPINTIKVNNCEIINRRPRSVTAAIFAQPTILTPKTAATTNTIIKATSNKAELSRKASSDDQIQPAKKPSLSKTVTKSLKIFRPAQQINATSVTSTIFGPRTKDMNKGYLMFSEDDTGLTSK